MYILKDRMRMRDIPDMQVGRDHGIGYRQFLLYRADTFQFRRKYKFGSLQVIKKRFDANMITGHGQYMGFFIPDGQGKHAIEPGK